MIPGVLATEGKYLIVKSVIIGIAGSITPYVVANIKKTKNN